MPKDLTKLSLKDLDIASDGELEQRLRWNNGHLELTVRGVGLPDDEVVDD
jgi:hypothetical protein